MLRSLRGLWRWYGNTEGDDPPPAFSGWHLTVAYSINLFSPCFSTGCSEPVFVLCSPQDRQNNTGDIQNLAVIGSLLSRNGSLIEM
jgi:hypothetical protein